VAGIARRKEYRIYAPGVAGTFWLRGISENDAVEVVIEEFVVNPIVDRRYSLFKRGQGANSSNQCIDAVPNRANQSLNSSFSILVMINSWVEQRHLPIKLNCTGMPCGRKCSTHFRYSFRKFLRKCQRSSKNWIRCK
jgi:hypothetical protein